MRIFRYLFDLYLQSSLHVGLAVLALLHCSVLQLQINVQLPVSVAVFCGTVLGYNFLKYAELVYLGKAKSTWHWAIGFCTALAAVCFVISLFQLSTAQQLVFLSSGFLVLGYPLLRRYGWFKLFFVSATVTYITVFIPLVLEKQLDHTLISMFIQRFFLLSSLLIPFEIWDSQFDGAHLHTLPQRLGIRKTKQLGYCLLLPVIALMGWEADYQLATVVVVVLAALSIYFTSLQRSIYYTSFWVESVPIVWWLILVFQVYSASLH
jgi:4-hydroxybenzoate polyprenyltransferase